MKKIDVINDVLKIIDEQFGLIADSDYRFKDDVGLDSLDFIVLIMECEKHFQIGIEYEVAEETYNQTIEEFAKKIFVKYLK